MTTAQRTQLFGVGLGPGDPELITIKARAVIERADVIAYPTSLRGPSIARSIAAPFLRESQVEISMAFPVTTEMADRGDGYEAAMRDFYDESAERIAAHLERGLVVAVLCEGDPFFYGSYMYLHERLAHRYPTEVIPGVTSFSAAAAAAGSPLVKRDEILTVLPGTLSPFILAERLRATDAAVVMKLGRTFAGVREAIELSGVGDRVIYVERASSPDQRVVALDEVDGHIPYMSLVLIPNTAVTKPSGVAVGELAVVGLGPAGSQWRTPEVQAVLASADELVGYATYLDRVPTRARQNRHPSNNREELDRARFALDLAASGRKVAVVSSGDPGIYAMGAAVCEVLKASGSTYANVAIRVMPGISAMQAAAARVGAPLGHDFCVISLSDQLKPWATIERRLDAVGTGDLVLVIYNPASAARRGQLERAREVLLRHRAPQTPVVIARDVGGPSEAISITSLSDFDSATVDMATVLLVGSSTTTAFNVGGTTLVYTPRHYGLTDDPAHPLTRAVDVADDGAVEARRSADDEDWQLA